jgi:hypothetical protein
MIQQSKLLTQQSEEITRLKEMITSIANKPERK